MRWRAVALAAVVLLVAAVAAEAVTLVDPNSDPPGRPTGEPWQTWADQFLAPTVPGEVAFIAAPGPGGRPGYARWFDNDSRVTIWVDPERPDARELLAHELGHAFDGRVMNDVARSRWKAAIMDWRPGWMTLTDQPNGNTVNVCGPSCEWFAEGYGHCALYGPRITRPVSPAAYGYRVGPKRHRRACRVLRMAAKGVLGPPAAVGATPGGAPSRVATVEADRRVTVLLLHGGGWQGGGPENMQPWADDFARHGMRAIAISYPLRDVLGAIEHVRRVAAQQPGPVVLYGISAGGTIAAALAAQGAVAGAINLVGPTDLTRWASPAGLRIMRQLGLDTYAERRAASPYWMLAGRQTPTLTQCGLADPFVEWTQCQRWAAAAFKGQSDTRLHSLIGGHSQSSRDRAIAREWIRARFP